MKKKTHDEFVEEVIRNRGDALNFLSEYVDAKTKVLVKCKVCGRKYMADPRRLIKPSIYSCKYCSYKQNGHANGIKNNKPRKYNYELVKNIIEAGEEYRLLSCEFRSVKSHIRILHMSCGNEYDVILEKFLQGCRCPYCCKNPIITQDIFSKRIEPEYKLVGKYINAKTAVDVIHRKCGKIVSVIPDRISKNPRCPYCNQSNGERKVEDYLYEHGYLYYREFSFDDLRSKSNLPLRYDFAVFVNDHFLLIEYDGEFHYEKIYEGQNYEKQKEHDEMKNLYAFEHGFPLLRIPFYEFDEIENRLEVFFKKYA